MKSLEELIILDVLANRNLSEYKNICMMDQDGDIFVTFEDKEDRKFKISLPKNRRWCNLLELYETYISTSMLRDGYTLVPIEGGHLVYGGKERYEIHENSCTCGNFIYKMKRSGRCQHLIFRDWHNKYRARVNVIKNDL